MKYQIFEEVDRLTYKTTVRFVELTDDHRMTGNEYECDLSEVDRNRGERIFTFSETDRNSGIEHKRVLHRLLGPLNYNEIIDLYFEL